MKEKEDPRVAIERIKKEAQQKIDNIMQEADFEISAHEAAIELENHPFKGEMGFCHIYWPTRKRILKEKYNIDWKTPPEENPGVLYD